MRAGNTDDRLAQKVAYLASGFAFAPADRPITVIETHTSWLFIGRKRVLKLKKPIRLPFLDFTTLARRHDNAGTEVRLNRRLACGVYRDPKPLRLRADGQFTLSGEGEVVDWLVDMRRLPDEEMLDRRIRAHRLAPADVLALGEHLGRFYRELPKPPDGTLYLRHLEVEQAVNRRILLDPRIGLDPRRVHGLLDGFDEQLKRLTPAIEARIVQGRIVEGHGDLRPCHVCLLDPPVIFDCLEFDRSMRLIDPLDEVTFLGIECRMAGARWVRELLVNQIAQLLHDTPQASLLHLYGAFRTLLRARLCAAHLIAEGPHDATRWLRLTGRYLVVARREIRAAGEGAAEPIRHREGA